MKNVILIIVMLLAQFAGAIGNEGGGGGAFVKAKFMSKAQTVVRQLRVPGKNIHRVNLVELETLLSEIDLSDLAPIWWTQKSVV